MFDLAVHDALEHRAVWTGAFLITAVTAMFTAACCYSISLGFFGAAETFLSPNGRETLLKTSSNLLFLSGAPAILVLTMVLNTLVAQTRKTHSQWRLAGASPQQVVQIFGIQVAIVSLCGAVAGAITAVPLGGAVSTLLGRGLVETSQDLSELAALLSILASVLIVSFWGFLSGIIPAVRASRTSALASQEPYLPAQERPKRFGMFLAFVLFVQAPLLIPLFVIPTSEPVVAGLVTLLPAGQALVITASLLAPYYLASLIRLWTNIPGLTRWLPWEIARHIASTRVAQSTGTVVPLAIGIGLFASFSIVTAAARNTQGTPVNMFDGILMLTPIGAIGAVGSAAVVFMAARRRTQDLTSLRVAGASPTTTIGVFVNEAVIYVVTALLTALVPALGTLLLLSISALRWQTFINLADVDFTGSWSVMLLGGLATVSIMVLGGFSAWRRPLATYLVKE